MIGKNITEKRWIVVIFALIIVFSGVVISLSIHGLASTKANNLTNSVELTKDIGGAQKCIWVQLDRKGSNMGSGIVYLVKLGDHDSRRWHGDSMYV